MAFLRSLGFPCTSCMPNLQTSIQETHILLAHGTRFVLSVKLQLLQPASLTFVSTQNFVGWFQFIVWLIAICERNESVKGWR